MMWSSSSAVLARRKVVRKWFDDVTHASAHGWRRSECLSPSSQREMRTCQWYFYDVRASMTYVAQRNVARKPCTEFRQGVKLVVFDAKQKFFDIVSGSRYEFA